MFSGLFHLPEIKMKAEEKVTNDFDRLRIAATFLLRNIPCVKVGDKAFTLHGEEIDVDEPVEEVEFLE
jgi:hypothetical protein